MKHINTLAAWLEYIGQSHPKEIELGLDRVKSVLDKLKLKPLAKKTVVVSGTNGKGSTIAMMAACLSGLGYRIGTYTSPHITNYNERVAINGCFVGDDALMRAFSQVEEARGATPLTYFEFGTLAAFCCFSEQTLDVTLLEVGLGGRLDAVNVIDADLAIICSVALDHVDWLGSDLEGIGYEKAGILRSEQQALLGEQLPDSVYRRADELSCQSYRYGVEFGVISDTAFLTAGDVVFESVLPTLTLPVNNVALALQGAMILHESFSLEAIQVPSDFNECMSVLDSLVIPGRLEQIKAKPEVFLDVGHNPHAAKHLAAFLSRKKAQGLYVKAVYSSLEDKDTASIAAILAPYVDQWALAPIMTHRAMSGEQLNSEVGKFAENVLSFESFEEALTASLKDDTEHPSLVLIFGSFHVVEAAKAYFLAYE